VVIPSAGSPSLGAGVRQSADYGHVVRTRVGEATAATWERLTEVRRVGDDKLLAQCRSVYVALDPATSRPRRVDASLRAPFAG